jgi:hypothetical protein
MSYIRREAMHDARRVGVAQISVLCLYQEISEPSMITQDPVYPHLPEWVSSERYDGTHRHGRPISELIYSFFSVLALSGCLFLCKDAPFV